MSASLSQLDLWSRARASCARAVSAIGAPVVIAAIALLTRGLRRTIVGYVFRLEHVVRKLLLIEAATLPWTADVPVRTCAVTQQRGVRGRPRSELDPSRPETWAARFSFALPRDPRAVPEAHAPRIRALWGETPAMPSSPPRVTTERDESGFGLARRFEALKRVLDDPIPHAERLARVLHRAQRRFPDIARRFVFAPARTNDYDSDDQRLSVDAMVIAIPAAEAFTDSS